MVQRNPEGYVPEFGQGLQALSKQPGTIGGKQWLKKEKLHKYWPMFSHWSYSEFISLTVDNIDDNIKKIGATGMTMGAKGKLLRCIADLRDREAVLEIIRTSVKIRQLKIGSALNYLQNILHTPFPTDPEHTICSTLITTIIEVYTYMSNQSYPKWVQNKLSYIMNEIRNKQILEETNSMFKEMLKNKWPLPTSDCGFEENFLGCSLQGEGSNETKGIVDDLSATGDYSLHNYNSFIETKYLSADCEEVESELFVTPSARIGPQNYFRSTNKNSKYQTKRNYPITNCSSPMPNYPYCSRFECESSLSKIIANGSISNLHYASNMQFFQNVFHSSPFNTIRSSPMNSASGNYFLPNGSPFYLQSDYFSNPYQRPVQISPDSYNSYIKPV